MTDQEHSTIFLKRTKKETILGSEESKQFYNSIQEQLEEQRWDKTKMK